ncbi:DNA cytosine methyltransferase [Photobacterium rosenbergii]|uniref:Cytosine-specific methyltransferase n=1 Tax=Photobacterium rosenbergii TaxID=294936 RepID=A0ABU3ZLP8_9GAMM|nr:DNA cytosine methyltransferase [Photobacterium rosenbergii]MDV5170976.1 DNA cytosine methyltransferase [Photobacterium rosenbergii]
MYEDLVEYIASQTISHNPELKSEAELLAAVTHWLNNEEINFHFKTEELVDLWETCVLVFCRERNVDLEQVLAEVRFAPDANEFTFIDLFAGIGGFNLSLQRNGGRCVFSSEWDKAAKKTYFKNYGKVPFGDINQFTGEGISEEQLDGLIPDHSILAGGFPCQPFSHAGVSARTALGLAHGFDCDTQGNLFHSIAKIAYVKQPKVVFMENVKNLVSHNDGETYEVIKKTMTTLGDDNPDKHSYVFFDSIINSQTVVAQRRVRCFMVCIREDIWNANGQRDFVFPAFDGEPIPLRRVTERTTEEEAEEYTISDKLWQGHKNRTQRNLERNTGFTAHAADLNRPSNTIVARYGKDGKECLIPQEGRNPRKLTRNECRQLFGYPEDFWIPEAKTPAYKQFGNSVVVPVVERISAAIIEYLRQ